jgi:putative DNA primase/helicase
MEGILELPSIQHYVQMIRDAAGRRRAAKLGENVQRLAEDPSVPTAALAGIANDLTVLASGIESLPPRFSEEALALRFSRRYAEDLRYLSRWGYWMRWNGERWVEDDTRHVFDLARGICRAASTECSDAEKTKGTRLASKATSTAVERLAAADRRHAATVAQWDADPWLLNTPKGTFDLRTGKIHEHRRTDHISKITAVGPGAECPTWLRFLDRVTGGNSELQSFLQRMVGYSLTGSTREHALFFLYGTGANGKSVFLSTISGLLGD